MSVDIDTDTRVCLCRDRTREETPRKANGQSPLRQKPSTRAAACTSTVERRGTKRNPRRPRIRTLATGAPRLARGTTTLSPIAERSARAGGLVHAPRLALERRPRRARAAVAAFVDQAQHPPTLAGHLRTVGGERGEGQLLNTGAAARSEERSHAPASTCTCAGRGGVCARRSARSSGSRNPSCSRSRRA